MPALRIHPDILRAANDGRPIVALETAVLTHGLPREPRAAPPSCSEFLASGREAWDASGPANVELARAMAAVVRASGATPATVGMLAGELVIGMTDDEIVALGADTSAVKVSSRDLGVARAKRESGGTTVAGTLAAIALANRSLGMPIRVFATGGIGGVHRGWVERPDISADLSALATTPVCIVSAGAKSILDLPATVEALDTLGVVVLGLTTEWFPRFLTTGAPPLAVQRAIATTEEAAAICRAHWNDFKSSTGVLLANPPLPAWALPHEAIERAVEDGMRIAKDRGVRAADLTPMLLAHVAQATGGRSVDANVAVLLANARVGAQVARALG
ncbi:MAG: pseudouridine-5'-phosphate glycosidase [Phycisphaerae bacterium]|mgnify:CR=1 FL=1|nr:pseudouridine-5'-phosphate glycosidase [Phycisphaerae bacterium]